MRIAKVGVLDEFGVFLHVEAHDDHVAFLEEAAQPLEVFESRLLLEAADGAADHEEGILVLDVLGDPLDALLELGRHHEHVELVGDALDVVHQHVVGVLADVHGDVVEVEALLQSFADQDLGFVGVAGSQVDEVELLLPDRPQQLRPMLREDVPLTVRQIVFFCEVHLSE